MKGNVLAAVGLTVLVVSLTGCSSAPTTSSRSDVPPLAVEDLTKKQTNNLPASTPESSAPTQPSAMNTTPAPTFDPSDRSYVNQYQGAVIRTTKGDVEVKFLSDRAPMAANNFLKLADQHFYDGILFHRVIKGFMIQGGDPNSKLSDWSRHGTGGPGYRFPDELDNKPLARGALAMANSGPNTNGSQFFILTAPSYSGPYTHFGEVVKGMEVVDSIESVATNENDHPLDDVKITGIDLVKK